MAQSSNLTGSTVYLSREFSNDSQDPLDNAAKNLLIPSGSKTTRRIPDGSVPGILKVGLIALAVLLIVGIVAVIMIYTGGLHQVAQWAHHTIQKVLSGEMSARDISLLKIALLSLGLVVVGGGVTAYLSLRKNDAPYVRVKPDTSNMIIFDGIDDKISDGEVGEEIKPVQSNQSDETDGDLETYDRDPITSDEEVGEEITLVESTKKNSHLWFYVNNNIKNLLGKEDTKDDTIITEKRGGLVVTKDPERNIKHQRVSEELGENLGTIPKPKPKPTISQYSHGLSEIEHPLRDK